MKIAIVGAGGAIGGLIACHFIQDINKIQDGNIILSLVFREQKTLDRVKNYGYCLITATNEYLTLKVSKPAIKLVNSISALGEQQDLIISTVPAYAITKEYALILNSKLSPATESKILLLCNGIPCWFNVKIADKDCFYNAQAEIRKAFGITRIVGGVIHLAASIINQEIIDRPLTIKYTKGAKQGGKLIIGSPSLIDSCDSINSIADTLNKAGIPTEIKHGRELTQEMLRKLQINIAINPIAALTQKNISELLKDKACRHIMFELAKECQLVFKRFNYKLLSSEQLESLLLELGSHTCSMAQHLREGKELEHNYMITPVLSLMNKWLSAYHYHFFNTNKCNNNIASALPYMHKIFSMLNELTQQPLDKRVLNPSKNQQKLNEFYNFVFLNKKETIKAKI